MKYNTDIRGDDYRNYTATRLEYFRREHDPHWVQERKYEALCHYFKDENYVIPRIGRKYSA